MVLTDFTKPVDWQYGQGAPIVRSSDCLTRLRVIATRPKSLNCRVFDGARSWRSSSSRACITRWRLRRSSMSMKSMMMMPPRSRRRIWRAVGVDCFLGWIDICFGVGVVGARGLADILAGVDVDGDQGFGLVDDD